MKKTLHLIYLILFLQLSYGQEKKVGIGTYQPEASLHVKGTTGTEKILEIENGAGEGIINVLDDGSLQLISAPGNSSSNYDILTRNRTTKKVEMISSAPVPEADPVWNQARVNTKTFKGNIPAGADLNNYLETGIYNVVSDDIASSGYNYPNIEEGELEVFNYESATYQRYHSGGYDVLYLRNRSVDGWSDWKRLSTIDPTGLERVSEGGIYPSWRLIGRNPNSYGNLGSGSIDFSLSSNSQYGGAVGEHSFVTGLNQQMITSRDFYVSTSFMAGNMNIFAPSANAAIVASSIFGHSNRINGTGSGLNANGRSNTINSSADGANVNGMQNTVSGSSANANGLSNFSRGQGETAIGLYGTDYTPNANNHRVFNVGIGGIAGGALQRKDGLSVYRDGKIKIGVEPELDATATKFLAWKDGAVVTTNAPEVPEIPEQVLENLNEGSGVGMRIVGVNSGNYGNIGAKAIDLSDQWQASSTTGATGSNSFTSGLNTTAQGTASSSSGYGTTASGLATLATGYMSRATASYSTAAGNGTLASGASSHAENLATQATGAASNAQGRSTRASGTDSHSRNTFTEARGNSSSASGDNNTAFSYAETVMGSYGTNYTANSATTLNTADRVLNVGIGTNNANRKDALTIYKDGKIKIGVEPLEDPTASKILGIKDGFLVSSSIPQSVLTTVNEGNGIGYRLAGFHEGRYGDIGNGAFDFSTQLNWSTTSGATGLRSFALGTNVTASAQQSFAINGLNTASGANSFASGFMTVASGNISHTEGNQTRATAQAAHAEGSNTQATGENGHSEGIFTVAEGRNSHARNAYTRATGENSTSGGFYTTASSFAETTIGHYSTNYTPASVSSIVTTDRIFNIGIGTDNANRKDALTIFKDGKITAPNLTKEIIDADVTGKTPVTKEWVQGQKKYKSYVALLNVWGENDPTVNVLENEIGPIEWVRTGVGQFHAISANGFTVNKTVAFVNTGAFDSSASAGVYNYTPELIDLLVFGRTSGNPIDAMTNLCIEIRVYY